MFKREIMENRLLFVILLIMGFIALGSFQGLARADERGLEELKTRIETLEKKIEKQKEESQGILGKIGDKVSFSGAIELDFSYADDTVILAIIRSMIQLLICRSGQ